MLCFVWLNVFKFSFGDNKTTKGIAAWVKFSEFKVCLILTASEDDNASK